MEATMIIKRILAAWLVLTMAGLTVGTGGCTWLWDPAENSAWNNLTCGSGTKGDFWGCNIRASLAVQVGNAADLAYDLAHPGLCGVIFCAHDGAEAAAQALAALNREADDGLLCQRIGTFAASLDRPTWAACLDGSPGGPECAGLHAVCDDPLEGTTAARTCCEGLMCDNTYDGQCCVVSGDACTADSDCCDTATGCTDGTCACLAVHALCEPHVGPSGAIVDGCCPGSLCSNDVLGMCCLDVGETCEIGADCCSGSCTLNACN